MKVRFDKEVVEKTLPKVYKATDDFEIFRYAELKKKKKVPKAWFVVRFSLKHMDEKVYDNARHARKCRL